MKPSSPIGRVLLWSLVLEVLAALILRFFGAERIVIGFFAIVGLPFYLWICTAMMFPMGNGDYIKVQNNFNLDAMRRNADQERYESWRKRN